MQNNLFSNGEVVKGYQVKVLNENEVRAAAGILFLFAIISFMNSWLMGEFLYTKIFVVAFLIEFLIRVLINPKYAPTLILAKFITKGQKPFYTGALQRKWAWSLGLVLAIMMFYLIVLNDINGPINLFTCLTCLILLFFEAAFGICLGCKIHKFFHKNSLQDCPSGKCEVSKIEDIQKVNFTQIIILLLFLISVYFISENLNPKKEIVETQEQINVTKTKKDDCQPPQWAIDIGHGEKWKLHHGCK